MGSLISDDPSFAPASEVIPPVISSLIDGAAATFDADRNTSRRYLMRASALLRANCLARTATQEARDGLPQGGLAPWQVERAIRYIETHLAEKITAQGLADLVDMSIGQLFRTFKVSLGTSPTRYIAMRRVALACAIMKTTREPLSQVAAACGLCDQAHLCHTFRRIIGVAPSVWRRAYKNGLELPVPSPACPAA